MRVLRFTIDTRVKVASFELHQGRKLRTEVTSIDKNKKSYLSDWTTLNVSVPPKKIPIYVGRQEKEEMTDKNAMVKKKSLIARLTSHRRGGQ